MKKMQPKKKVRKVSKTPTNKELLDMEDGKKLGKGADVSNKANKPKKKRK